MCYGVKEFTFYRSYSDVVHRTHTHTLTLIKILFSLSLPSFLLSNFEKYRDAIPLVGRRRHMVAADMIENLFFY